MSVFKSPAPLAEDRRCHRRIGGRGIQWKSTIALAALALVSRAVLLPMIPHPEPLSSDEKSYVFQAEIFTHGRLAFPAHPLWRFFQVANIISHPVWMSKYFGGQSLFLAIGVLLGNAHWGVILSFALFVGAVHWMLQQIAPPRWALAGALAVLVIFNVRHYWLESYWGGFVAAIGGCLVLSAFCSRAPRLPRSRWLFPLGAVLLCTTRPFEGLVFVLVSAAVANPKTWRSQRALWIAPFAVAAFMSLGLTFAFNWLTLGGPLRFPYLEHERQYATAPTFWVLSTRAVTFNDPVIESVHEHWEMPRYKRLLNMPLVYRIPFLFLRYAKSSLSDVFGFSSAILLLVPFFLKYARIRRLALVWILVSLALILENWTFPHYTAPVTGTIIALGVTTARAFMAQVRHRPLRHYVAGVAMAVAVFAPPLRQNYSVLKSSMMRQLSPRQKTIAALAAQSAPSVILVHYSRLDAHAWDDDWVRNSPNIDHQRIIWARDRGTENVSIVSFYAGRKIWILDPDERPLCLRPYLPGPSLEVR
jgi:hypothetical protein